MTIEIIKRFSKYAEVVHLWNVKIGSNLVGHFPTLPSLKPEEGWAPIGDYFKIIIEENPNVKIMFENRSDLISDEELENCYSWIKNMMIFLHQSTSGEVCIFILCDNRRC